ncbi:MAG: extracellular solute-binding protein [Tatlockia sp.]|nr:extracellular solute-binding protein [Tatlockia sp.]
MRLLIFLLLQLYLGSLQAKPVEILMWYSLAGQTGEELRQLVAHFNEGQKNYAVKLIYKGEYTEALTSFAAAFRAKQPPAIVQIFEVGTATMLHPKGIIKPVDELMQEQGLSLPKENFLPAVRAFYSKANHLLAMPFNTSIPVIFYNADLLEKLGYGENSFPHSWDEMEVLASRLKKAGNSCAFTSAYPSWILLESFSAIHGLPMVKTQPLRADYNNKAIIYHLKRLKRWQTQHYFEYGGRASDATVLFTSGRCALFSQSSGSYNSLAELVKFRLGVALLPLDTKVSKIRYNNVAGGAALWAVAGQQPIVYRGIAEFFSYLAQPEVQLHWHQRTGYLPLGTQGIYSLLREKSRHPALALAQIDLASQQKNDLFLHLGPQNQIRTINDESLEAIFAGIKKPKQAIDDAVKQANYSLFRFIRNTGDTL